MAYRLGGISDRQSGLPAGAGHTAGASQAAGVNQTAGAGQSERHDGLIRLLLQSRQVAAATNLKLS